jgi:excisionase family DNA binding protein
MDISLDEAAQQLGLSRRQVIRLIAAGVLTGRRVGGNRRGVWLIDAESVEREAKRRQNAKD